MLDSFDWKFSTSKAAENYSTSVAYANMPHPNVQEIYNVNLFPYSPHTLGSLKSKGKIHKLCPLLPKCQQQF